MGSSSSAAVEKAITARETTAAAIAELNDQGTALATAHRKVERQLVALHFRDRAVFEQEAEQESEAAEDALAALGPQLQAAASQWAEAQGAWGRLGRHLYHSDAPPSPPRSPSSATSGQATSAAPPSARRPGARWSSTPSGSSPCASRRSEMADPHAPCYRCQSTDPEAFDSPTSAFCSGCWTWLSDPGRRFGQWIEDTLRPPWRGWLG
jgi:hypothetical protein